jgi:23S rRNA (cytosine1962-C5)-methyltransferase
MPAAWTVGYRDLTFAVRLMGFKHTGLFPEQAANWDAMTALVKGAGRPVSVLNLFAYTGGASVALAKAGATVTHVDAAKNMCERAGENARLSKTDGIRYIVDDCMKFVAREERRGKTYDAIVMDPPSYGRGANGELWKLEDNIHDFARATARILSPAPLFCLINSYTTGLQPAVMSNILQLTMPAGGVDAYELCLPTDEGIVLPCGCSAMWKGKV